MAKSKLREKSKEKIAELLNWHLKHANLVSAPSESAKKSKANNQNIQRKNQKISKSENSEKPKISNFTKIETSIPSNDFNTTNPFKNAESFLAFSDSSLTSDSEDAPAVEAPNASARQLLAAEAARAPSPRPWPSGRASELPTRRCEAELVDAIRANYFCVVVGDTGCGKSTQLPRILLEHGFGDCGVIGVTEPRRIAAVALARRVAEESDVRLGREVGYQVRYDSCVGNADCRVKFMTDGILLNEMVSDAFLKRYSVIVLDEVHERKLASDVLLGLLARIVEARNAEVIANAPNSRSLRVVLMSATINAEQFLLNHSLFKSRCGLIRIEGESPSVVVHHSRTTPTDYFEAALRKATRVHRLAEPGDLLVFLTGRAEVAMFCEQLRERLLSREGASAANSSDEESAPPSNAAFLIYPLHSRIDPEKQNAVFAQTPNARKIVVATNVAETSITVSGLRYVIDCGREKRRLSGRGGALTHSVCWISRASAEQRKGRVGRTGAGVCYRLYSLAMFAKMEENRPPEALILPLHQTLLQLSGIGVRDLLAFPFPSPPPSESVARTLAELVALGALQLKAGNYAPTELGRVLATLPLAPRLGRVLLQSLRIGIGWAGLLVVAALESEELFAESAPPTAAARKLFYKTFLAKRGDLFTAANILGKFFSTVFSSVGGERPTLRATDELAERAQTFGERWHVSSKALVEAAKLVEQIASILGLLVESGRRAEELFNRICAFSRFSVVEERTLSRFIAANFIENVIVRRERIEEERSIAFYESNWNFTCELDRKSLVSRSAPFCVYQTLIAGSPAVARTLTRVDGQTLFEIDPHRAAERLTSPERQVRLDDDRLYLSATYAFGPAQWEIAAVRAPLSAFRGSKHDWEVGGALLGALLRGELFPAFRSLRERWKANVGALQATAFGGALPIANILKEALPDRLDEFRELARLPLFKNALCEMANENHRFELEKFYDNLFEFK